MEIFVFTEALGKPGVLITYVVPLREGMFCLLSTQKAARCVDQTGDLGSICGVIHSPSVRSSPPYCKFVFLHGQSMQPVFMDFTKRFHAFTSDPSLAYLFLKKIFAYLVVHMGLCYHQSRFSPNWVVLKHA